MKIIMAKLDPTTLRMLSVAVPCDPRTLLRALRGLPIRGALLRARVAAVLAEHGIVPPHTEQPAGPGSVAGGLARLGDGGPDMTEPRATMLPLYVGRDNAELVVGRSWRVVQDFARARGVRPRRIGRVALYAADELIAAIDRHAAAEPANEPANEVDGEPPERRREARACPREVVRRSHPREAGDDHPQEVGAPRASLRAKGRNAMTSLGRWVSDSYGRRAIVTFCEGEFSVELWEFSDADMKEKLVLVGHGTTLEAAAIQATAIYGERFGG